LLFLQSTPGFFGLFLSKGQVVAAYYVDFFTQTSKRLGKNLGDGAWHQVQVNVTSGHVLISVDSEKATLQLSATAIQHFPNKFYMGTPLNNLAHLGLFLIESKTYSGCTRKVQINGLLKTFELAKSSGYSLPDAGCKKEDNCHGGVCGNGGTCVATWTGFECKCLADFSGKTCQNSK
jgi:hypothetical protein